MLAAVCLLTLATHTLVCSAPQPEREAVRLFQRGHLGGAGHPSATGPFIVRERDARWREVMAGAVVD